ncbi:MAG: YceD family protein [Shimia sp.]
MDALPTEIIALAALPKGTERVKTLTPTTPEREAIARALNLLKLRKLTAEHRLTPEGARNWRHSVTLGATVEQACVVTDVPVVTRIDVADARLYSASYQPPTGDEAEMPDETIEPLPASLDLWAVTLEVLSLELPDFPRADDAELGEAVFAADGVTPMTDEAAKPFAGLAALKDKLSGDT